MFVYYIYYALGYVLLQEFIMKIPLTSTSSEKKLYVCVWCDSLQFKEIFNDGSPQEITDTNKPLRTDPYHHKDIS